MMQIDLTQPAFQAAIPILQQIEAAGFEAYFVGGSVRDALLGLPIHDVDIASSAYPEEIKRIFKKTVDTGIQHGTVMVLAHGAGYEVTTFRTESTYQDFRRPDHVTFVRSLKEDLKRRDFTINALAVRHDGTVIDWFDGLHDLETKTLKAVGTAAERFQEDALRMMRAVRFESQLDFRLEAATKAAITSHAALLAHISVERSASEFTRLMLGPARSVGLTSLNDTGLGQYLPGLVNQEAALTRLAALPGPQILAPAVAWTLVATVLGVEAGPLLANWKQANALQALVGRAQNLLSVLPTPWVLYQAQEDAVAVASEALRYLDPAADGKALQAAYERLPIKTKKELAVSGKDLMQAGFRPGPSLGKTLLALEQAVVAGQAANTHSALLALADQSR